jgi:hypothetical protein
MLLYELFTSRLGLTESGEAGFLYHWIDTAKAQNVFETDVMPARWTHTVDRRDIQGNSFSRNPMFKFGEERCFRITVDKRALSAQNRIIPLDAEFVHSRKYYPKALANDRKDRGPSGSQFAEEFVVGDIHNLHRIITKLEVRWVYQSGYFYKTCEDAKNYCNRWDIECVLASDVKKYMSDTEARWVEDDEWKSWNGGKSPVSGTTPVEVQMRDGFYHMAKARDVFWGREDGNKPHDIIAYRAIKYIDLSAY